MIEDRLVVRESAGLHARSARVIVDELQKLDSEVMLVNDDTRASGDSILELMTLRANAGTELSVEISGPDAQETHRVLQTLFENGFQALD